MDITDLYKIGGAGFVIYLLSIIKVPKLEIPVWKWIGRAIGKWLNGDISDRIDKVEQTLDKHIKKDEMEYAKTCRRSILRFNDEVLLGEKHTQEHFNEVLDTIDDYENYCAVHPDYPNNKAVLAVENIKRIYANCLKEHSFL